MTDYDYQPQANTKIGKLLAAMRAQEKERPVWTPEDAAKVMGVTRSTVPPYLVSALSHRLLFRRTGQGSYELSLKPFDGPQEKVPFERFTPPPMSVPRAGSDVKLGGKPPPNLCTGCSKNECWDNGCQAAAANEKVVAAPAPAPAPTPAPTQSPAPAPAPARLRPPAPAPAPTPAPTPAPEPQAPARAALAAVEALIALEEEDGAEEPDAYVSCRTGEIVLVGLQPDEQGRITIPVDLVTLIKRQIVWSLAR
jgi:cell division septation protein DedD